jgi:hypothetical protein
VHFFFEGDFRVFAGVFEKTGEKTWVFGGELVV